MHSINRETVLEDLPEAIIIKEILVRLPAEDILHCRAVRKSWRHATSTNDFLLAHHKHQPSLPVIDFIKREGEVCERHLFVFCDSSTGADSRKLNQRTILWDPDRCPYIKKPAIYGAYDGLLVIHGACDGLLVVSFNDESGLFDVCNPSTRQRAPLPLLCDDEHSLALRVLIAGFYQHSASGEYRVLYSIWRRDADILASTVDFHILAVGSSESRSIGQPPLQHDFLDGLTCSKNAPVLYHENLHWLLEWYYTGLEFSNIFMFDTEVETFRWMRNPPRQYPWMSLLDLDGVLAMCSRHDGDIIDIYVMHDYEAEVWTLRHRIKLSTVGAPPQSYLPARIIRKIVALNERELLIEHPSGVSHCDINDKLLGKMEWNVHEGNHVRITSFRFQENIVPLPFFGMQEDHGHNWMLEEEEYEMLCSI
jgi:hypothetical protein